VRADDLGFMNWVNRLGQAVAKLQPVKESLPMLIARGPMMARGSRDKWRVTRNARPLLRAEERAIVQRMSNENTEVKSFFTRYEAANAIFDVEQIAACYAEVFMFGGPEGVQCVKKEDFLKVLPRRKEFFRSRGLVSSNIDFLATSTLDSRYTLVKVVWKMRFDRSSEPIYSQNTASYILSGANDRFQIVFQIDHQDLTKRVQELGLE
jgi:hypothetical protein